MEVQPAVTQSISQGVDSSPWQILDTIALGNRTLNLTAPISLSQAVAHLEALTEPEPSDPLMSYLTVSVSHGRVVAQYNILDPRSRSLDSPGSLGMVRPLFRGNVSGDDEVQLRGRFGINTFARLLGLASVVLAVASVVGTLMHVPLSIGVAVWIAPAAFVFMCLITRANGDDIHYIEKNLEYALYGDAGS
jgi:hypothetical protein